MTPSFRTALLPLLFVFLLVSSSSTSSSSVDSASDGIGAYAARRVLHQPLYPIQWTPPPPPPEFSDPSPPATGDPSSPFFRSSPATSATPAAGTDATVAANVSSSRSGSAKKSVVLGVVVGVSLALLALLLFSGFLLYRRRRSAGGSQDSRKLIAGADDAGGGRRSIRPPGRAAASADFLYLGTVEPGSAGGRRRTGDADGSSPYRKLGRERVLEMDHQPSPELQPLPRLSGPMSGRIAGQPPPRRPPSVLSMASSDDDTTFYTPNRSVASATSESPSSPVSRRSLPSMSSEPKEFFAAAAATEETAPPPPPPPLHPRSKRTSPRMQLVDCSNSEVKQMIPPTTRQPPRPPPPPPPPPPPMASVAQAIGRMKPPAPPPPPPAALDAAWRKEPPTNVSAESPPIGPISRRRLLKPLPPEATQFDIPIPPNKFGNGAGGSSHPPCEEAAENADGDTKPKLKPLHWDKVRASSDRAMVWDQLKAGSFQLNEDMIEALFVNNASNTLPKDASRRQVLPASKQENRVLDPKKSQNIAILLRALNVTKEEVSEALLDGNPEYLGTELLETLVKMAPTKEEELKLQGYSGDVSKLGSAECFLKAILDIPFAFKRVDAMLYRANFEGEVNYLMKSFETLEAACGDLRSSRLFLKLLEAVLRTGNRMNVGTNRGQAKAFKLDTLLKLADVKGTDGKTTLLHFVVQEIIRSEGSGSEELVKKPPNNARDDQFKKQGLKVVAGLSSELGNVRKAAGMDSDVLSSYLSKLEVGLEKIRSVLQLEKSCTQGMKFFEATKSFLSEAEKEIERVKTEEKRVLNLVKEITEYFHGDAAKEEAHPLRIFVVVRDFLSILDNVCKEVGRIHERTVVGSARSFGISTSASLPVLQKYDMRRHNVRSDDDDDYSSSS